MTTTGYFKVLCSCSICKKVLPTSALPRHHHYSHQFIFPVVPSYSMSCKNCKATIKGYDRKSFCTRSCAAVYNNKLRNESGWSPSAEQRSKVSSALSGRKGHSKNKGKRLTEYREVLCKECGAKFEVPPSNKKKYCSTNCRKKNLGGHREKSGYSKSGYFKGIYCGSTYELAWVIYRLDHKLHVERFEGFIKYDEGRKYFPDFVEGNTIHEMKGWNTSSTDRILLAKNKGASAAGYKVKLYFKNDLQKEFNWVKENYNFSKIEELYDGYKPRYELVCRNCGFSFYTDNKHRKCCSRKCSGQPKGGYKISHSSSGQDK